MNQGSRRPHLGKGRQRPTHGSTDAALGGHRAGQPRERLQKQGRTAHATRIAGRRATRAKNQKANGSGGRTNAGQKGQKAKAAEQRGRLRARVHCTEHAGQGRPAPTTGGRRAKRRKGIKPNKRKSGSMPRMRTEKGSTLSRSRSRSGSPQRHSQSTSAPLPRPDATERSAARAICHRGAPAPENRFRESGDTKAQKGRGKHNAQQPKSRAREASRAQAERPGGLHTNIHIHTCTQVHTSTQTNAHTLTQIQRAAENDIEIKREKDITRQRGKRERE